MAVTALRWINLICGNQQQLWLPKGIGPFPLAAAAPRLTEVPAPPLREDAAIEINGKSLVG